MLLLDALFALLLYKLFGTPALYILGITCAVMFLRTWGNVSFVARVYSDTFKLIISANGNTNLVLLTLYSSRGCLFYGPPGTGKTLVARALANECSQGDKKVAFFMRKGADCLSKWVGESERQLRLLFDQVSEVS